MQRKNVVVNDVLIGEVASWDQARALMKAKGIAFIGKSGMAEGPTGFYFNGALGEFEAQPSLATNKSA